MFSYGVPPPGFRILCFIKILQPPLGYQNLDRTITYTRFHGIEGGDGVPPPPPITLIEWIKFKDFYESCSLSRWEQDS